MKDRRRLIIDSALAIFAEQGLVSPPIPTITRNAGVATGTFYSYFKSREDLISVIYAEVETQLVTYINDEELPLPASTTEKISNLIGKALKFFLADRNRLFFFYHFHNSPFGAAYRKQRGHIPNDLGSTLSPLLQEGIDAGVIVAVPIDILFKYCVDVLMNIARDHHLSIQPVESCLIEKITRMSLKSITK